MVVDGRRSIACVRRDRAGRIADGRRPRVAGVDRPKSRAPQKDVVAEVKCMDDGVQLVVGVGCNGLSGTRRVIGKDSECAGADLDRRRRADLVVISNKLQFPYRLGWRTAGWRSLGYCRQKGRWQVWAYFRDGDGGAAQRSREREQVIIPQPHFDSFRVRGLKLYHYKRRVKRL